MNYQEGHAEENGIKIAYRDYGPEGAEPILLVHGLGAQLVHWPVHLIDFLIENNYRPITYDNRDAGLSSRFSAKPSFVLDYIKYYLRFPLKSEYTLKDMSKDGISVLNTLNIDKAHILGTSMGGMIGQIICSMFADRVKSFTLIASTASVPGPLNGPTREVQDVMLQRSKMNNPTLDDVYQREIKWVSLIGMEGRDLDTDEFREDVIANYNRAKDKADGFGYARQLLAILASKNRIKRVKAIKVPTLIIHGERDPVIDVKNAYRMEKLIPNSKLIVIPNMRHLIEEEILDQFKQDLLIHLKN
ncbi:alpha/beta hydrolase [Gammaproteobacteria bacterium]|jgi:pimeloyl-ACP methyl ester carboxylesterase|nr:alpha/beta hydrolase [Gammaproteobacteria bacterium]